MPTDPIEPFIARWRQAGGSERGNYQLFLNELADVLGVELPQPHAAEERDNAYVYERRVTFRHGDGSESAGFIDLYRRGAFVCEAKRVKAAPQTRGFDEAMLSARSQAERYARALPAEEGRPPFLMVVDVGHRIELYAEFSRSGATYTPFPDPRSHRIGLDDLRDAAVRERLRKVWLDPLALDPARESARVTREIATRLAELARSLERAGHAPEAVAQFLMRCLFTMFAEDVRLLPAECFRQLLERYAEKPDVAMRMLAQLWREMDAGGFSAVLAGDVLRFNGKLFKQPDVLPLDRDQIALLLQAARADWKHVEPAIFGTLLERALSPDERHKLGAHYTPRAYVERLVLPTVIEPLRAEWSDAQAAALTLATEDKADEAVAELLRFHHRLCTVRVLDPACGSGNFLYVTLEHLKRLEGEVLNALDELGHRQAGLAIGGERADAAAGETVDPNNLMGIEINPRAAAIAEVVLWIGYLQWHFRTRGDVFPPQPVIRDFRNIECRDALLAYDRVELETDEHGRPVTRWDGRTMKSSPVTRELIPDEAARASAECYVNPRTATWPEADFVVGNPPFVGNKRMRVALGDGYVEALRVAWPDVPESADMVMYWWHHAAQLTRHGLLRRFGLITTNSIRQVFNRRVIERAMEPVKFTASRASAAGSRTRSQGKSGIEARRDRARRSAEQPVSLVFAIPDHPWVEATDGAAVRITMTVVEAGDVDGLIALAASERASANGEVTVEFDYSRGRIGAEIRLGANASQTVALRSNEGLCWQGVKLVGDGFLVKLKAQATLVAAGASVVRNYMTGRDLVQRRRDLMVIDFAGLTEDQAREANGPAFQQVLDRVKPLRDQNREESRRLRWWLFGRSNEGMRRALAGLTRFVLTPEVAKYRPFLFSSNLIPDASLYAIATDDGHIFGVVSSVVHERWATFAGGTLEDRPRYHGRTCFDRFPFPSLHGVGEFSGTTYRDDAVRSDGSNTHAGSNDVRAEGRILRLAEQLDAHRKHQQSAYADLTLTSMYNVLQKLRSGETLSAKERTIHEQGLVSVLRQLHDELDAAVLEAYGWSDLLPLLRVAHGNEAPSVSPLPPSAPSPASGGREAAKRAFDEAILERLVALNAERAAEEARGLVRWLRPEFQNPTAKAAPKQERIDTEYAEAEGDEPATTAVAAKPLSWPKDTVAQVRAVSDALAASSAPLDVDQIAARFSARGPWKKRLPQLLAMLVALGRAQEHQGRYRSL